MLVKHVLLKRIWTNFKTKVKQKLLTRSWCECFGKCLQLLRHIKMTPIQNTKMHASNAKDNQARCIFLL